MMLKRVSFLLIILCFHKYLICQDSDIEAVINATLKFETPSTFKSYYVYAESYINDTTIDSLSKSQIRDLEYYKRNFPLDLYYKKTDSIIDWREFILPKVSFIFEDKHPTTNMLVKFVPFKIENKKYDSIVLNRPKNNLVVKKRWFWSKKRIWKNEAFKKEVEKAFELNKKIHPEEFTYIKISRPIFSENGKYAKVSTYKNRVCDGYGNNIILKRRDDNIWEPIYEFFDVVKTKKFSIHRPCGSLGMLSLE